MSFHDVDFLLELQRRAVDAGQAFLAGSLCALLTERMEEERRAGRLDVTHLARVRRSFRHNLALLEKQKARVKRLLSRTCGDHDRIKAYWPQ